MASTVPFDGVTDQLKDRGFPEGLANGIYQNTVAFPLRIWVLDNSGSMNKNDGRRFTATTPSDSRLKVVSSSRWNELKDTMNYHIDLAAALNAPSIFRLLNPSLGVSEFGIADKGIMNIQSDVAHAKDLLSSASVHGTTPLTRHIHEIRSIVQTMAPSLEPQGKKVVVILATDGLPTDETGIGNDFTQHEFRNALNSLNNLPIWLVVRLCTDEDNIVKFYNELDNRLEISVETLDDFESEAQEVYKNNDWLNYTLPLHRCREMGYHNRLLDMIDERPLTKTEVRDYCMLIFGVGSFDNVPDPNVDWNGFLDAIKIIAEKEGKQWNPIKRKPKKWISISALKYRYGHCTIM